jgi:hypothetical protein
MGQTTVSLIVTVIILNIYHRAPHKPVPPRVKRAVFGPVTTMLCMRGELNIMPTTAKVSPTKHDDTSLAFALDNGIRMQEIDVVNDKGVLPTQDAIPNDVIIYIRWLISRAQEQEVEDKNKSEWIALAKVLDRFMLYIFLILAVLEMSIFTGYIMV